MSIPLPPDANAQPHGLTADLARFVTGWRYASLPEAVRAEAVRAFVNWFGCVLGGSREPVVKSATTAMLRFGGAAQATIIGHSARTDIGTAAFLNCMSSSCLAYDDAHLATVTHPTGPVAAALFALSERQAMSGEAFLSALALGIELQCRLSNLLLLPPAKFNLGFYVTGLTAPIGVAAALGHVLGFDEQTLRWAMAIAASQASGFRATHGTMTAHFRPGHAARAGVVAAVLAQEGFDGPDDALEADKGFIDVFSSGANLDRATDGLGTHFELLSNGYKPYPCGIVIHPVLDACLELRERFGPVAEIASVVLTVHPLTLRLTGVRAPRTPLESHVSVYHWAAAMLLRGAAGVPEMAQDCIDAPEIAALRSEIVANPDSALTPGEACVEVTLRSGEVLRAHTVNARGSVMRPMTNDELDIKFRGQVGLVLREHQVEEILALCWNAASLSDFGGTIGAALKD